MVSNLSGNLVNSYISSLGLTPKPVNFGNNGSNQPSPTSQKSTNLVDMYLESIGAYNKPIINKKNTVTYTPSGIGKYDNYSEIDASGKEVTSVKYTKNGSEIIQTTHVVSYDGSTIDRVISNDSGLNKMNLLIKDAQGNVLLDKNKTYQKLDNDKSVTVVNGQRYNMSGLSGDVLSIEHNGQVTEIDLNKLISRDTCTLLGEEGRCNAWSVEKDKLSSSQKSKLMTQLKSLPADDLLRLKKSVDAVHVLESKEGYESFYDGEHGENALLLGPSVENSIVLHELGHAINYSDDSALKSEDTKLVQMKEYEAQNFSKRCNSDEGSDFFCYQKFIDYKNMMDSAGMTKEEALKHLRDEAFAESYSVLNNSTLLSDNEVFMSYRTLGLMKAFPKTMVEVERMSTVEPNKVRPVNMYDPNKSDYDVVPRSYVPSLNMDSIPYQDPMEDPANPRNNQAIAESSRRTEELLQDCRQFYKASSGI